MSARPRLLLALALLVASFAEGAPCAAQSVSEPPIFIDVLDNGDEARRVVPYELIAPDGTAVVSATCREQCDVPTGWWRGPGTYVFIASDRGTTVNVPLDLHGDEHRVRIDFMTLDAVMASARIDRFDPAVRARFVAPVQPGDPWIVEVDNPTDVALTVSGQPRAHWALEPTRAGWTAAEREARTFDTQGWCGTGIRAIDIPAHATTRLELNWPSHAVPPGSYRGLLRAHEPGGSPLTAHVITFAIEVVTDAAAPSGIKFTAGP